MFLPDGVPGSGTFQALVTVDVTNTVSEFYLATTSAKQTILALTISVLSSQLPRLTNQWLSVCAIGTSDRTNSHAQLACRNTGTGATVGQLDRPRDDRQYNHRTNISNRQIPYDAAASGGWPVSPKLSSLLFVCRARRRGRRVGQLQATIVTDVNAQQFEVNPGDTEKPTTRRLRRAPRQLAPYPELSVTSVTIRRLRYLAGHYRSAGRCSTHGNAILTRAISDSCLSFARLAHGWQ